MRRRKEKVGIVNRYDIHKASAVLCLNYINLFVLLLPAARTAVLSFMKAKETSAREKDLYRSVKVKKLTVF